MDKEKFISIFCDALIGTEYNPFELVNEVFEEVDRQGVVANLDEIIDRLRTCSKIILNCFDWAKSNRGFDFWGNVYRKIREHEAATIVDVVEEENRYMPF